MVNIQQQDEMTQISINPFSFETAQTSDKLTIIKVKENNTPDFLARIIACKFMKTSLLVPACEMKIIVQEKDSAQVIKNGSLSIPPEEWRKNPDASRGLWVDDFVGRQTRAVQNSKENKID